MEMLASRLLISNAKGKVRHVTDAQGRKWVVANLTSIVPGVLAGSKGALLYRDEDISRSAKKWDGMPLVVPHPVDPLTNQHISAFTPGVLDKIGIGHIRNTHFDGKLRHEAWFDAERTRAVSPKVWQAVVNGRAMEVSTGLYTDNEDAEMGAVHNGVPYSSVARNFRPDHMAVLPDEVGACSVRDGCGLHVNANPEGHNQYTKGLKGDALKHEVLKYVKDKGSVHSAVGGVSSATSITQMHKDLGHKEAGYGQDPQKSHVVKAVGELIASGHLKAESSGFSGSKITHAGKDFAANVSTHDPGNGQFTTPGRGKGSAPVQLGKTDKAAKSGEDDDSATSYTQAEGDDDADPLEAQAEQMGVSVDELKTKLGVRNSSPTNRGQDMENEFNANSDFDGVWNVLTANNTEEMNQIFGGLRRDNKYDPDMASGTGGKEGSSEHAAKASRMADKASKAAHENKGNTNTKIKAHVNAMKAQQAAAKEHEGRNNKGTVEDHFEKFKGHAEAIKGLRSQRDAASKGGKIDPKEPVYTVGHGDSIVDHVRTALAANCSCERDRFALNALSDEALLSLNAKMKDGIPCGNAEEDDEDEEPDDDEDDRKPFNLFQKKGTANDKDMPHSFDSGAKGSQAQAGGKGTKEEYSANSDAAFGTDRTALTFARTNLQRKPTMDELLANAAPEDREAWEASKQVIKDTKLALAKQIVFNSALSTDAERNRVGNQLMLKPLAELRELAALVGNAQPRFVAPPVTSNVTFAGASGGPTTNAQGDSDDILEVPTMNWRELSEENGRNNGKASASRR